MTTEEKVRLAQSGDDEAYYDLIKGDQRRLYAIAYSYMRSEADALEAIQEATCRGYVKIRKLREPAFFHTWFIRILIHYCVDEQKRRRRAREEVVLPGPSRERLSIEDRLVLWDAVDQLKPEYRHIIILKYEQDMTLTEIARVLDKPEGTVKTWLHQALKSLRSSLGQEGEIDYVGYSG